MTTRLPSSPSQTVGPYLAIGLTWPDGEDVVTPGTPGELWVRGRLFDGHSDPVPDGMVETWQADPDGRFDHPDDPRGTFHREGFRGFGRSKTRSDGSYALRTVKPGRVPDGDGGLQAPHLLVSIFARGMGNRVVTRIYFADEAEANAEDAVLNALPDDAARATLLAEPVADGYRRDLVLQGDHETVFFAL